MSNQKFHRIGGCGIDKKEIGMEETEAKVTVYKSIVTVLLVVANFIVSGLGATYVWNTVVSEIFGVMTLTFWQVYGIKLVIPLFFGSHKSPLDDENSRTKSVIYMVATGITVLIVYILKINGLV